jgi:hypothetical protein
LLVEIKQNRRQKTRERRQNVWRADWYIL